MRQDAAKFLRFALRLENRLTQYAKKIARQKTITASSHAFDSYQDYCVWLTWEIAAAYATMRSRTRPL